MRIPSLAQSLQLMDQYGMLVNIRHHSLVVARLVDRIHAGLCATAPDRHQCDRNLVVTGALLHDIAKTPCLRDNRDHAKVGADICRQEGFAEIAVIVAEHVILGQFEPQRYQNGTFNAREIVYYADKRVRHHLVVDLNERLQYILDHYGRGNATRETRIRENFDRCFTLERYLFQWLPFPPGELGAFSAPVSPGLACEESIRP
ncbi:HDIG domain-containing metalloprotein [Desulfobulbus alkaliphilus]|uniref:HDIG domain-containing metalloprotein n=1 Tax=Desulfobulbus alkaliphilus TaxID=869814 RepID=UPI001964BA9C|nr:HDIG domain-containing metalloprotein [Desulfobulbus alkaliphilus]MBM9538042.1 HDIG domain-containing protein [Desulfobulbus alkaliphilus]